ncbi:MAG TPA: helicase-related protein [Acidobacteriaceae bacterium]|nr:helicase-related protein [Acidobacteriaceae bacterium]
MTEAIRNRGRVILPTLQRELVGPAPEGRELDCRGSIIFATPTDAYGPWRQAGTGEEILQRDVPTRRYGIGVLYPQGASPESSDSAGPAGPDSEAPDRPESTPGTLAADEVLTGTSEVRIEELREGLARARGSDGTEDLDLTGANTFSPSSLGVSFLTELPEGSVLKVRASGGRYRRRAVQVGDQTWRWWLREPVVLNAVFTADAVRDVRGGRVQPTTAETSNTDGLDLRIEAFARTHGDDGTVLLTICLVNRTPARQPVDDGCLFQADLEIEVVAPDGSPCIRPYPVHRRADDLEEQRLALLYRKAQTFAVGHGCAADWSAAYGDVRSHSVRAVCLPHIELPNITSDVLREDRTPIEVSMAALAGLVPGDDGFDSLQEVFDRYAAWVDARAQEARELEETHRIAADRHLEECLACVQRMRDGLHYLRSNAGALQCFRLANEALLIQQLRGAIRGARTTEYDAASHRLRFSEPPSAPDLLNPSPGIGKWRAFQIAFLLASIRSTVEGDDPERETVELIWFPTGGGKTEAYFGLVAFAIFMRRLADPGDVGVHALMRYTLRLLTAQQFQRASRLICAMESIRRRHPDTLGQTPISIGMWLGRDNTPNTREQARDSLRRMEREGRSAENPFAVLQCPWCRAQMGPLEYSGRIPRGAPKVVGYEEEGGTVRFRCPDAGCAFARRLPIYVIDDDLYDHRPDLVIGTVDKFASLAWMPRCRALFGLDSAGERTASPPGLVIQDELHLIAGPLGSMVGLYEALVEDLCTDHRPGRPVRPKIVCSTATIRRYPEQILALYGRDHAVLFPPPALEAGDSFFAAFAKDAEGRLLPGKVYVGIHAPGLRSLETAEVRTFTSLLQAPVPLAPADRDPWWTLLVFYNNLTQLGTGLSLLQTDVPDYLRVLRARMGLDPRALRRVWNVLELTGRLPSEDVPRSISALETPTTAAGHAVDVCLASNIIEVGVDIDRLSLMALVGQPKTTSQYIQVTGRVGRRWKERPGLVATIYSITKPRDRSHFEKFRSYHERLYAQVEPTSVTPFSLPALERALHAVVAGYVRQWGPPDAAERPYPLPAMLIERFRRLLRARVQRVSPGDLAAYEAVFDRRITEWQRWERRHWSGFGGDDAPLLRDAGGYVRPEWALISWPTPRSMRNVDAECQIEITQLYLNHEEALDA